MCKVLMKEIKKVYFLVLLVACAGSILLGVPTICNNIYDPNMIVYFNSDEGGQMDLAWFYYSGHKRDSFQWDFDYGLEMIYLSDVARFILSKFINLTPGTFVLILRWIHLTAWILSFLALWRLISYHFARGWQPALAVTLLATRPAFAYFSNNLKPEPLVLFFIIIGLDYALRIIERPSQRNLFIAVASAAFAVIIKFAGLFLLPAIVASMYFGEWYQRNMGNKKAFFPRMRLSFILPALCGVAMVALPLAIVLFYIRKSTGTTWYEECGIWTSLLQNKLGLYSLLAGIFFIFLSVIIWILNKNNNSFIKRIMEQINTINSYSLIVFVIFTSFIILVGFRWIFIPKNFILTCAFLGAFGPDINLISMIAGKGFLYFFLQNLIEKIVGLDPVIFLLFLFYLSVEIYFWHNNFKGRSLQLFKRLVLLIFLLPLLILICTTLRVEQHHMLPFFVAMSILAIQGVDMFRMIFNGKKLLKNCILSLISMLFLIDILVNGSIVIKARLYQFYQHEDVAFDIAKWWRENIPVDARIAAEHYNSVYIPVGYKNIKTINWSHTKRTEQLRQLVENYKPQFIYYNENPYDEISLQSIEEILPGKKAKLIKSFDSASRRYQRKPGDKFVIYEILY